MLQRYQSMVGCDEEHTSHKLQDNTWDIYCLKFRNVFYYGIGVHRNGTHETNRLMILPYSQKETD